MRWNDRISLEYYNIIHHILDALVVSARILNNKLNLLSRSNSIRDTASPMIWLKSENGLLKRFKFRMTVMCRVWWFNGEGVVVDSPVVVLVICLSKEAL